MEQLIYKRDAGSILNNRSNVIKAFIEISPNIGDSSIQAMSALDLKLLFGLYDRFFFDYWFRNNFKGSFKFSLSQRMTKSAGMTIFPRNAGRMKPEDITAEIRIGADFFLQYGLIGGEKSVCGIKTSNSLDALQIVLEHEICHAVEFILYGKSNCGAKRFKIIANDIFGHTGSYHRLPTYRQIANCKLGLNVGDTVSFTFEGGYLEGIIYRINKRATVMVRDRNGQLADKHGTRYSKYYVPLDMLTGSGTP